MSTTHTQDARLGEQVLEWVAGNFDPEDVYGYARLEQWAEHNGFIRTE